MLTIDSEKHPTLDELPGSVRKKMPFRAGLVRCRSNTVMLNFSTDELRPQDRFEHWCELRGRNLFGVTIELPRERRADFFGRFSAVELGGAVVSEMQASSYKVSRTNKDIGRLAGNSLCIARQVRGPGWMDVGRGRILSVREGDLAINHSDLPYIGTPQRSDGFHFRMVKIPLAGDILLAAPAHDLFAATAPPQSAFARPLSALFNAITGGWRDLADPSSAVTHMARLAMLERGRLPPGMPECRAALRAGFFHAACEILERDHHLPKLSPGAVARELGISLRQVHVLFEPTGLSFSRTLTAMRIRSACRMLETMPTRSVIDIAFASGFDSLATFYRAFRDSSGMTPTDMRSLSRH
jgi:AraC-like DNA-binding protein